jgi:extracellular factor (EF) 3-hydroxypalmitic acid methyl ester biosynthesis protein
VTSFVSANDLGNSTEIPEPGDDLWAEISGRLLDIKQSVAVASRAALARSDGKASVEVETRIVDALDALMQLLHDRLGPAEQCDPRQRAVGRLVHADLLPLILLGRFAQRAYAKPLGYAGDFETISRIYKNAPDGEDYIGTLVDRYFLNSPPAIAVRNRRELMVREMTRLRATMGPGCPFRLTSLACGPACETIDLFESASDPAAISATLVDGDPRALAFVFDKVSRSLYRGRIRLVHGNLLKLADLRRCGKIAEQDMVFSLGLIDYFRDDFVVPLLDYAYEILRPGGEIVVGNFHADNMYRAMLDYVLDWVLVHRTERDMERLFALSRFGQCDQIFFEDQHVNMFARAVRRA